MLCFCTNLIILFHINPLPANVPILHPLKTPENQRFSGVFKGYKAGTQVKSELKMQPLLLKYPGKFTPTSFNKAPYYTFSSQSTNTYVPLRNIYSFKNKTKTVTVKIFIKSLAEGRFLKFLLTIPFFGNCCLETPTTLINITSSKQNLNSVRSMLTNYIYFHIFISFKNPLKNRK